MPHSGSLMSLVGGQHACLIKDSHLACLLPLRCWALSLLTLCYASLAISAFCPADCPCLCLLRPFSASCFWATTHICCFVLPDLQGQLTAEEFVQAREEILLKLFPTAELMPGKLA